MKAEMSSSSVAKNNEPLYLLDKPECKVRVRLATWQQALEFNKTLQSEHVSICREKITDRHMMHVRNDVHAALLAVRSLDKTQQTWWSVAFEEAIKNGMRVRQANGIPFSPEQFRPTELQYGVIGKSLSEAELQPRFLLRVRDEGDGFDPRLVLNPSHSDHVERENGRGLWMMIHALCICQDKKFDARLTYFPMDKSKIGKNFRTRDLAIEIPLQGEAHALMEAFLNHPKDQRAYVWDDLVSSGAETTM